MMIITTVHETGSTAQLFRSAFKDFITYLTLSQMDSSATRTKPMVHLSLLKPRGRGT